MTTFHAPVSAPQSTAGSSPDSAPNPAPDFSTSGVLIVADDLTGANATAAGFSRAGLRAVTAGARRRLELPPEFATRFDAVVISTDGRHSPPAEAGDDVAAVIGSAQPAALVCNRIDSTLRGNVGATTAAALRAVSERTGQRAVALCAPAHPDAGRQTVQGTQLLDGVRLEETELAHDPRSTLPTSEITALLAAQAPELRAVTLPLSAVTGDPGALRQRVADALADGVDVLVADALTTDHLDRAATAAVAAGAGGVSWVGVDPGPGSLALARALGLTGRTRGAPLLAVSGSTTRLTREQLARLCARRPVRVVRPVPEVAGGVVPDVAASADALAAELTAAGPGEVVLLATVLEAADVVETAPSEAARLPVALAATVRRALRRCPVEGLFATGGDVGAAILDALDAYGLDVQDEVVPLAVAGHLVGGAWAGLPVVTKGGLVGTPDTTVACLAELGRLAVAARRQVRSPAPTVPATPTAPSGPAAAEVPAGPAAPAVPAGVPSAPPPTAPRPEPDPGP